jgi:hypothetical protein
MSATTPSPDSRKALRWLLVVGVSIMLAMGLVLLFLLMQATQKWDVYAQYFTLLFGLNAVVAGLLLAIIVWIAVRLALRWRQGKFGSRLLVKLAAIFAVVGFLPGLLIYGVSYQFVSRSIEAWFDVKVEGALDAGLNLGRATLDTLALDLGNKTRAAAAQLNEASETSAVLSLERVRAQLDAEDVVLWASNGSPLATVGNSRFQLNPERPASGLMRQLRNQAVVTTIEGLEEALKQPDVKPCSPRGLAWPLSRVCCKSP